MRRAIFVILMFILVTACEPNITSFDDIDFEELEGMQTACAKPPTGPSGLLTTYRPENSVRWVEG